MEKHKKKRVKHTAVCADMHEDRFDKPVGSFLSLGTFLKASFCRGNATDSFAFEFRPVQRGAYLPGERSMKISTAPRSDRYLWHGYEVTRASTWRARQTRIHASTFRKHTADWRAPISTGLRDFYDVWYIRVYMYMGIITERMGIYSCPQFALATSDARRAYFVAN